MMEGEVSNLEQAVERIGTCDFCTVYFNCYNNFVLLIVVGLMTKYHFP